MISEENHRQQHSVGLMFSLQRDPGAEWGSQRVMDVSKIREYQAQGDLLRLPCPPPHLFTKMKGGLTKMTKKETLAGGKIPECHVEFRKATRL